MPLLELMFPMIYVLLIYNNFEITNEIFDRTITITITLKNTQVFEEFSHKIKGKVLDFMLRIFNKEFSINIRSKLGKYAKTILEKVPKEYKVAFNL